MRIVTLSLALFGGAAAFAQTAPKAPGPEAAKAPASVAPEGGEATDNKAAKSDNVDLPETLGEILTVEYTEPAPKKKTAPSK